MREPVHHPSAETYYRGKHKTVKNGTKRHNAMTGKKKQKAEEDGITSRKINDRLIGEIVDELMIVDILRGTYIYDGIRRYANTAIGTKHLYKEESGNGYGDSIIVAGEHERS